MVLTKTICQNLSVPFLLIGNCLNPIPLPKKIIRAIIQQANANTSAPKAINGSAFLRECTPATTRRFFPTKYLTNCDPIV